MRGRGFRSRRNRNFASLTPIPCLLSIRGFTPDIESLRFGRNMKTVEIPVVSTCKPAADPKSKTSGDLTVLGFVPKSFVLE